MLLPAPKNRNWVTRISNGLIANGPQPVGKQQRPSERTYSTWNPSDIYNTLTLSNGDLTISNQTGSTTNRSGRAKYAKTSGKWYFEVVMTGNVTSQMIGVAQTGVDLSIAFINDPGGWGFYGSNGFKFTNNTNAAYANAWAINDVISLAVDLDAGKIWLAKNGTWQASGDPAAGTNAAFTNLNGSICPAWFGHDLGADSFCTANFGASAFTYTVPTGFNSGWYTEG